MINLFGEIAFKQVDKIINANINNYIKNLKESEILNSDINILSNEIAKTLQIKILNIDLENRDFQLVMKTIKGRELPAGFDVQPEENTDRAKVSYKFYITNGDIQLLSVIPKEAYISKRILALVGNKEFTIEYQTTSQTKILDDETHSEVKKWRDLTIEEIRNAIIDVNSQAEEFNLKIYSIVKPLIENKLEVIQVQNSQKDELK